MKLKTTIFLTLFLLTTIFNLIIPAAHANNFSTPKTQTQYDNAFYSGCEILLNKFADIPAHNLLITCSLFPVYDFTRVITGELAEVRLLIKPGIEPHEFEPSALDVKALNDSDAFIFTSPFMEQWAGKISQSLTNTLVINASDSIALTDNDPHIWLDLELAQKMTMNIARGLSEIAPEHTRTFTDNAKSYCSKLAELDKKFFALNKNKALVFAGEFSAQYFMRRYGFDYVSAYDGENEPSIRRLAQVLAFIRNNITRYIFSDFGEISKVTRSISNETGAEILIFNTAHNVLNESASFLEIMTENYRNIKKALND